MAAAQPLIAVVDYSTCPEFEVAASDQKLTLNLVLCVRGSLPMLQQLCGLLVSDIRPLRSRALSAGASAQS